MEIKSYMSKWPDTHRNIIVAIEDDEIVGAVIMDYSPKDKKEALLWNLQVDPTYRNGGIGKLLFDTAIEDAARRKYTSVFLEWSAHEAEGWVLDWYKREGFKVDSCYDKVRMKKDIKK